MRMRILNWCFVALFLMMAFVLGDAVGRARSASYDPFIMRIQMMVGVQPGGYIPVDTRFPDVRLRYITTTPIGRACYQVQVCRVR